MTREWIEPIYDRTYGNVQNVQSNPDQDSPKGAWNAVDLNRLEHNTAYCAEWMLEQKIVRVAPEISVREDDYWTSDMIPTKTEIDRIINNIRLLVSLSSNNPAIADDLPTIYAATQINYVFANQLEYALYLMHDQPKLPLEYWTLKLNYGLITTIVRADGTTETVSSSTALVAEDEVVTILGTEYGDYAQYQEFKYWSGAADDIGLLADYQSKQTTFTMPYRDVEFTAVFETHIPRTLTLTNAYISENSDPTAESGPTTGTYLAGDEVMIIADRAASGKMFYEWIGTEEALDQIVGVTSEEDPSTAILTMPDCDVTLESFYINAGQHSVTVTNGTGGGYYNYKDTVTISATVPDHYEFSYWSGNTSYLSDIYTSYQSFTMGDENISFRAYFNYVYSYNSVQVIDGLITVNGTNVSEASSLKQTTSYTLVPTPPDDTQGLYYWGIEGKGSIATDAIGNHTNTFTVGDGNAIITGYYSTLRTLSVVNVGNSGNTTTYSIAQGRKQRLTTTSITGNYKFKGWYEDETRISTNTTITVEMGDSDRTIEAKYDYYPTYTITVVNRNNSGATTTYEAISGDSLSLSTTEDVGDYLLVGWNKNGTQVSTSTSYSFTVTASVTIEVEYRPKETYYLTVNNGSGSGSYLERQSVTITADDGDFSHWSYSNLYSITNRYNKTTTVKLGRADGTVTANYNMRTITVITNSGTTNYSIRDGDNETISSGTAPATYEFSYWEITSGDATLANMYSSSTRVYAHSEDSTITAVYTPIPQFTVTMEDGYIQNSSGEWVESATLLRNATNVIQMKPAPTGYQFLQWEVYENGVLQTDANDVYEPLAETSRLRNLLRDITIKATYYIPDPTVTYTLSIERKDGTIEQSSYAAGTDVNISASTPDEGMEFYKWSGDTAYVAGGVYNEDSYVHMPAQNVSIKENYVAEGYIPMYELVMTNIYGECCYTTESTDSETGETTVTEHWTTRYEYEEGTEVKIRTTSIPNESYFSRWTAKNHDTEEDVSEIIDNLTESETTVIIPAYDIDVEPSIALKDVYKLTVNNGGTSGYYYEGARADIYFSLVDTDDIHYEFSRWTGSTITTLELYDGGMFSVTTPGDSNNPQYIKMPAQATEVTANYTTKYRLTINGGTIDTSASSQDYFVTGTEVKITADAAPTGMTFQYWSGDTDVLSNKYDATPTVTTVTGTTTLTAVYSTNANRNNIGYVTTNLKDVTTVNNSDITIISGAIEVGFIITDSLGHIYIITSVNSEANVSTIYRMTKIVQGGNTYV